MTGREDDSPGTGRRDGDEGTGNRDSGFDRTIPNRDVERLPEISRGGSRDFPGLSADFRVDILDHGDEVIVVAELPGAEEDAIRVSLLNPHTLRITARRAVPAEEAPGAYYIHERGDGILSRLIRLPASVTGESAATRFKNGVLELRLKKVRIPPGPGGKEIPIE
ncbi:Hsp20/alpha crystallin family protein [Methanoculleus sp. YWC-01]|uniref:Hsp20/alpha crystallin family protein n=2 Tax=Methanoculleus nereidis TaxID=2735141 RepID=A0ABU3Z1X1_9EURY|nr:Hsp20/alpha crystallin family protein [Methanoculleus sp.]MDV4342814.1 Hsp20/alpha crystallin family protein [Methanoculleus sp. YWC-01]PKL56040.1 MAG: Hsp20/alpha crystallin family protein [Methanomicrobiales archaeon HGW-Methanomicrobiales-6]